MKKKVTKSKIKSMADIIPMLEQGKSLMQIAREIGRSKSTIMLYAKTLRDKGFILPTMKRGRRYTMPISRTLPKEEWQKDPYKVNEVRQQQAD